MKISQRAFLAVVDDCNLVVSYFICKHNWREIRDITECPPFPFLFSVFIVLIISSVNWE